VRNGSPSQQLREDRVALDHPDFNGGEEGFPTPYDKISPYRTAVAILGPLGFDDRPRSQGREVRDPHAPQFPMEFALVSGRPAPQTRQVGLGGETGRKPTDRDRIAGDLPGSDCGAEAYRRKGRTVRAVARPVQSHRQHASGVVQDQADRDEGCTAEVHFTFARSSFYAFAPERGWTETVTAPHR